MRKSSHLAKLLTVTFIVMALLAPIVEPIQFGGNTSQQAALAQDDGDGAGVTTADETGTGEQTDQQQPDQSGDTTGDQTGGDTTGGDQTGDQSGTGGDQTGGDATGDQTGGDTTGDQTGDDATGDQTGGDVAGDQTGDSTGDQQDDTTLPTILDEPVITAAIPAGALEVSCIVPDVTKPNQGFVELWSNEGVATAYGPPEVTVTLLQDYQNQDVPIAPIFSPNPQTGFGHWTWGETTGAFHIQAQGKYTPLAGGAPETVTVKADCTYIALPTATRTPDPARTVELTTEMFRNDPSGVIAPGNTISLITGSKQVHDTAQLYEADGITKVSNPGGTVSFALYSDAGCTNRVGSISTVSVSATGAATSGNFTISGDGEYHFRAKYNGPSDTYIPSDWTDCSIEWFKTGPEPTNTPTATATQPGTIGVGIGTVMHAVPSGNVINNDDIVDRFQVTGVYDTATIYLAGDDNKTPLTDITGSVTYNFYANASCTGTPQTSKKTIGSNGSVPQSNTFALGLTPNATYNFTVTYSGDGKYATTTSGCMTEWFRTGLDMPTATSTSSPTITPTPTATKTSTSKPVPPATGGIKIVCGNSSLPGGMAATGRITVNGGYAIVNYSYQKKDGTFEYFGPLTFSSPQTNAMAFQMDGVYTKAYLNAVFWDDNDKLVGVANASSQCETNALVNLIVPEINGNECVDGAFTLPTVVVPESIPGLLTYEVDQPTADNGWAYTVTVTILDADLRWGDLADGWETNGDVATYSGTVTLNPCTVLPAIPDIVGNTCTEGVYTPPSIAPIADTAGIHYQIVQPDAGNNWTYSVTATLTGPGYVWDDFPVDSPWTPNGNQATASGTIELELCTPIVPVTPQVDGNTCIEGTWVDPSITAPVDDTNTLEYQVLQQPSQSNNWTYILQAKIIGDGVAWGDLVANGWREVDDTTATKTVQVQVHPCDQATPAAPKVEGNTCIAGVFTPPTVAPVTTPGLTYSVLQQPTADNGWQYIVQAKITQNGWAWGNLPRDWDRVDDATARLTGTVTPKPCTPMVPVEPSIYGNTCVSGVFVAPVIVPGFTVGLSYSVTQQPTEANGWTYKVNASIIGNGRGWGDLTGTGWTPVSPTLATYEGTVRLNPCTPVQPVDPEIDGNTCISGVFTPPVVNPVSTPGLTYTVTQQPKASNNWTYKVTARITSNGYAWDTMPGDWQRVNATTATLTGTVSPNLCTPVSPVAPDIDGNACVDGVFQLPSVSPVETTGVTYTVTQDPSATNNWTYIIKATITSDGFAWGSMPSGWFRINATEAVFSDRVTLNPCTVLPVNPAIDGNTCIGGVFTPPSVNPVDTAGITYVVTQQPSEANGWTYAVTATRTEPDYVWGSFTGSDWRQTSSTKATLTGAITPNLCTPVMPVEPQVDDNACVDGVFLPPVITPVETTGLTYTVTQDPNAGNNWTYIIEADITGAHLAWDDFGDSGWTKVSDTKARLTKSVDPNLCTPIVPAEPQVEDNECVDGVFQAPNVVAGPTEGLSYEIDQPTADNGWTYTVTATITGENLAWGDLTGTGWTKVDGSTTKATYSDTVTPNLCTPILPVDPQIEDNECVDGVFHPPLVTPAETTGLTYRVVQQPNQSNGWTYIVEADITGDDLAWGDLTETNWEAITPTTARLTDTVTPNLCAPPVPVNPDIEDNECVDGVFVAPNVVPVDTPGVSYTVTQQPTADNGWTYIVEAEITLPDTTWGDLSGTDWDRISGTEASLTGTVTPNFCKPIVPVAPEIDDNTCVDGVFAPPVISPVETTGLTYTVTQDPDASNDWTYIVEAEITGADLAWGDLTGTGWTRVDGSTTKATFTDTVEPNLCTPVIPVDPDIDGNECVDGVFQLPSVSPVETTGVSYTVTQDPSADNGWTYTVTATVDDDYAWGDLTGTGWTWLSDSEAEFSGTVELEPCMVLPADPPVEDNECVDGVFAPPVIAPVDTPGLTYTVTQQPAEDNGWTYKVTVEITEPGYVWDDFAESDWTKISDIEAEFEGAVTPEYCTPIVPVAPDIDGNECVDGVFQIPVISPAETTGLTYTVTKTPSADNGWSYTVEAEITTSGLAWGDLADTGWTKVDGSNTKATYSGTVELNPCDVLPVDPAIDGNECVDGVFVAPNVVPVDTPGLTYAVTQQPAEANGWTYTVTATITEPGYVWDDFTGSDWTPISDTEAELSGTVTLAPCEVLPVNPAVEDNVCIDGVFLPPVIAPVATSGLTYTVVQQPNADNNWTYKVSATITGAGYIWDDLAASDWTPISATEAELTRTVTPNPCTPVVPVAPKVTGNSCIDGVSTPPVIEPVATTGVTYIVTQQPKASNGWTYTVRATVNRSYGWGDLTGTGWTKVNGSNTTATFTSTVEPKICVEVIPPRPTLVPGTNVCVDGFVPPVIAPPSTHGVAYTVVQQPTAQNRWFYVVEATIVDGGLSWGNLHGSDWVAIDSTHARSTGTVVPCITHTPSHPSKPGKGTPPKGMPNTGSGPASAPATAFYLILALAALAAATGLTMRRKHA